MLKAYIDYAGLPQISFQQMYEDFDFTDFCILREILGEIDLDKGDKKIVKSMDEKISRKIDFETLQLYIDYYQSMPIKEWWGPRK